MSATRSGGFCRHVEAAAAAAARAACGKKKRILILVRHAPNTMERLLRETRARQRSRRERTWRQIATESHTSPVFKCPPRYTLCWQLSIGYFYDIPAGLLLIVSLSLPVSCSFTTTTTTTLLFVSLHSSVLVADIKAKSDDGSWGQNYTTTWLTRSDAEGPVGKSRRSNDEQKKKRPRRLLLFLLQLFVTFLLLASYITTKTINLLF